jgi:hypothetical protein
MLNAVSAAGCWYVIEIVPSVNDETAPDLLINNVVLRVPLGRYLGDLRSVAARSGRARGIVK